MAQAYDVVVVGGAVMGSSIACHLAADPAFSGRILVLEQDPSYQGCASALSAASIRQQYSSPVNVAISLYGIAFLREIGDRLMVDGERPDIGLTEGGYLFLAGAAGAGAMTAGQAMQARLGADIALLDPEALTARFPWLSTEDVVLGSLGLSGEGWFDGYGLMQAFRRKARSLGVTYEAARAVGAQVSGGRVTAVTLADGRVISCGVLVNAAGTGGPDLARALGIDLPVRPRKRMIFTFTCADPVERCPLLIDPTGVYVRPEGTGFLCGTSPAPENDPDCTDYEVEHGLFDEVIWPTLAARVPAFERIRPGRAWAGHYDLNLFDQNAILGPAPGLPNFHLCNGFSGHGLQQSPAVGRGIAELIVHGRYVTLDLSELGYGRIADGRPLTEAKVV
ncbi:NAD(P)/FAD-dependent oxidoreductase [Aquabacter cavernae]|uniref:NAD(P)/FAD-dependent oxidoreductase n=1 Tax=Aquabacter cavernae TaxID=2496029 RepID=UPI000F8D1F19|nr:FAD-binding oxidoreductase [Aquabacter cavernae]